MEILQAIWTVYTIASVTFTTIFLWNLFRNIRKELKVVTQAKEFAQATKIVYIEQADGIYRMHDKITDHFICQAESELEVWRVARERFPDKNIITLAEDREVKNV